jgi:hypothetical protein
MPGLVPGIHVFVAKARKTWMAGSSAAMTNKDSFRATKTVGYAYG